MKFGWFQGYLQSCFLPTSTAGAENTKCFYFHLKGGQSAQKNGALGGYQHFHPEAAVQNLSFINQFLPNLGFSSP